MPLLLGSPRGGYGLADLAEQALEVAAAVLAREVAERDRRGVGLAILAHAVTEQDAKDLRMGSEQITYASGFVECEQGTSPQ